MKTIFILAIFFSIPVAAQIGLGLTPMRAEYRLAPGGTRSGTLQLTSEGSAKVRVRGELLDFFIDDTGTPQFARSYPREAALSCRSWLSLNPMETEVEAAGHINVRYTIRVPANSATGQSYHCAAGFTTLQTVDAGAGMGIKSAVRVIAAFYVILGNPPVEGDLARVQTEYVADPNQPGWRAVVTLRNRGLMYFRPSGDVDLVDTWGTIVQHSSFAPLPVLPNREQRFLFPLHVAADGKTYTLRARVDVNGREIQEATIPIDTRPPER